MTIKNIAEVEWLINLQEYQYKLWNYQVSHQTLTLRATKLTRENYNIHIVFSYTHYIQIPTRTWVGNFRLGTEDEKLAVLKQAGLSYPTHLNLFISDAHSTNIYILGILTEIIENVEPVH